METFVCSDNGVYYCSNATGSIDPKENAKILSLNMN